MITVLPQPAQEREPSRRRPWHQGPGDADCRWNLFSMYCRPVWQVIFANWLATTSAMSGKSPIHSSRRLVLGSGLLGSENHHNFSFGGDGFPNRRFRIILMHETYQQAGCARSPSQLSNHMF